MRLSHHDYEVCSRALRELYAEISLPKFSQRVLPLLMKLVPSGHVSWNTFDRRRQIRFIVYCPHRPELQALLPQFKATFKTSPLCAHAQAMEQRPKTISDFVTVRQFRETAIFQEYYRHAGTKHQVIFSLSCGETHVSLALNRLHRDFSERDRGVLAFLSPHIAQAYNNARIASEIGDTLQTVGEGLDSIRRAVILARADGTIRWASPVAREWLEEFFFEWRNGIQTLPPPLIDWIAQKTRNAQPGSPIFSEWQLPVVAGNRLLIYCGKTGDGEFLLGLIRERVGIPDEMAQAFGLTPREAEILFWISESKTNPEIAIILGASVRTIHKHTEHLFEKLKVENRLAAQRLGLELRRV